ncbi:MAG: AhpC/TSA family protein [Muribaculaceae bacterium]|nr:AhpC/TSA family protein [Muribaculaceae bacterium]
MKPFFSYLSGACLTAAAASCLLLASCGEPHFKIKGEIYGAEDMSVVLEKSDFHGRWVAIDSTRTSSTGSFSISRPAPAAPEVFRLELGGRYIYFPIDSVETVTVSTSSKDFGTQYTLSGTPKAEAMERFDKEVMALPADISVDSLESFKKNVFSKYMKDAQGSIVSYYALTKTIGDKPLFNPEDDYKYFAAVATGFKEKRPSDPHTALLEQTSLNSLKRRNSSLGTHLQIEATELKVIDIELPDENGTMRKLSDYVGKGKPVVVMFSVLTHPDAPALNIELSKLYSSRGGDAEFYQVSLDPDQYSWRDAARNLPWVTVFDPDGSYSKAARSYNVSDIPTFFIYDRNGELTARAATFAELKRLLTSM